MIDDKDIQLEVVGNLVTLNGSVTNLFQRDETQRIASNAPGIFSLTNELLV